MPSSNSDESQAFYLLDEKVRRWVWNQGWTALRDAQERAIPPILAGKTDVIIAAATATGKTEAAFLPICSRLLLKENQNSCILYLSPLKALINDQFSRIQQLCELLNILVHPWHGDISGSRKQKFLKDPKGILLITPESLESMFVNNGPAITHIFEKLLYVVVDEVHHFIGSERGQQLQSLLHRIESAVRRRIPRIGLSATIGDIQLASQFLRHDGSLETETIISDAAAQELRLLLKGYVRNRPILSRVESDEAKELPEGSLINIGVDIFNALRGSSNLIFANSRNKVEFFADRLRCMCEALHVPNEFWPHHGSLSKELREDAEAAIKDKNRPVNIICTSTLEMGIDIGAVASIAQIGVPPSVASMRQRLGRSGRKEGDPAILRIYIQENELTGQTTAPTDSLRVGLVQTIAMVKLLLEKWYEPPLSGGLHFSILTQQLLSLIAQYGGVTALQAYNVLCKSGPFNKVTQQMFADFLRSLGASKLITQASDGLLLHGELGEKIVNHYTFYTAFSTPQEFRLICGSRTLGTLPIDRPLSEGSFLIFGGKRWLVLEVDSNTRIISLAPAKGGRVPIFGGEGGCVHDRIRQEMFAVYRGKNIPVFLDAQAKELLVEARKNFQRFDLVKKRILKHGNAVYLFCWRGDRVMDTLATMMKMKKMMILNEGIALAVLNTTQEEVCSVLLEFVNSAHDACELASTVVNKAHEKYDHFITDKLLSIDYAASRLDIRGALSAIKQILAGYYQPLAFGPLLDN